MSWTCQSVPTSAWAPSPPRRRRQLQLLPRLRWPLQPWKPRPAQRLRQVPSPDLSRRQLQGLLVSALDLGLVARGLPSHKQGSYALRALPLRGLMGSDISLGLVVKLARLGQACQTPEATLVCRPDPGSLTLVTLTSCLRASMQCSLSFLANLQPRQHGITVSVSTSLQKARLMTCICIQACLQTSAPGPLSVAVAAEDAVAARVAAAIRAAAATRAEAIGAGTRAAAVLAGTRAVAVEMAVAVARAAAVGGSQVRVSLDP